MQQSVFKENYLPGLLKIKSEMNNHPLEKDEKEFLSMLKSDSDINAWNYRSKPGIDLGRLADAVQDVSPQEFVDLINKNRGSSRKVVLDNAGDVAEWKNLNRPGTLLNCLVTRAYGGICNRSQVVPFPKNADLQKSLQSATSELFARRELAAEPVTSGPTLTERLLLKLDNIDAKTDKELIYSFLSRFDVNTTDLSNEELVTVAQDIQKNISPDDIVARLNSMKEGGTIPTQLFASILAGLDQASDDISDVTKSDLKQSDTEEVRDIVTETSNADDLVEAVEEVLEEEDGKIEPELKEELEEKVAEVKKDVEDVVKNKAQWFWARLGGKKSLAALALITILGSSMFYLKSRSSKNKLFSLEDDEHGSTLPSNVGDDLADIGEYEEF